MSVRRDIVIVLLVIATIVGLGMLWGAVIDRQVMRLQTCPSSQTLVPRGSPCP